MAKRLLLLAIFVTFAACKNAGDLEESSTTCTDFPEEIYFPSQMKPYSDWNVPEATKTWNLFSIRPNGKDLKPITSFSNGQVNRILRVSPSGKYLSFYTSVNLSGKDSDPTNLAANAVVVARNLSSYKFITQNTLTFLDTSGTNIFFDDRRIAFSSFMDLRGIWDGVATGGVNTWISNLDGSNLIPLTKNTKAGLAAAMAGVSPDGTLIVTSENSDLSGIWDGTPTLSTNAWIVSTDGKTRYPLTKNKKGAMPTFSPVFFPDGSRIAYFSKTDLSGAWDGIPSVVYNIWTVKPDGTDFKRITNYKKADLNSVKISPDMQKIAFQSRLPLDGIDGHLPLWNIWIMNIDGTNPQPLTKNTLVGYDSISLEFSPNGNQISFYSKSDLTGAWNGVKTDSYNLWVVNADGTGLRPLTKNSNTNLDTNGAPQYSWAKEITCKKK